MSANLICDCVGPSSITGIFASNERCSFQRGRVGYCLLGRKIGIFGLPRVVLHGFPVTKKSIRIVTHFTNEGGLHGQARVCRRLLQSWIAISLKLCRSERCQWCAERMAEGTQPRSRRSTRKPLLWSKVQHWPYLNHLSPDTAIKCTTSCRQYMNFLVSIFPNAVYVFVWRKGEGFYSNKHRSF